jgi:hemerythrin
MSPIAAEHEQLAELAGRIRSAIAGSQVSEVRYLLLRLAGLYESHFRTEEEVMTRLGYPALEAHRREHCELVETLGRVVEVLHMEDLHGVSQVVAAHIDATLRHTIEADRRFLDFMERTAVPG